MKKSINILGALTIAAALTASFTACSNEENIIEEQKNGQAHTYSVSIPANYGGAETRAVETGAGGKLVSYFKKEDNICVYNTAKSNQKSSVNLKPDADGSSVNLTGNLTFATDPAVDDVLLLSYTNNANDMLDYTNQTGTLVGLSTYDYASATVKITDITGGVITTEPASFINAQSMYKFTFTGLPTGVGVKSVVISSFDENHLCWDFTWKNNKWVNPVTITLDAAARTANGAGIVYAALRFKEIAADAIDVISFTVTGTDNKTYVATKTSPVGGFQNSKYYTSTITLLPEGTLAGKFTINEGGTQVYFSKGNLQATFNGSTWTWAFAVNQWDYIGNAAGNTSINGNGTVSGSNVTVDLFGWVGTTNTTWSGNLGTTGNAAMHGISNSTYGPDYGHGVSTIDIFNGKSDNLKSDWGTTISDGFSWRTLSRLEWKYLLYTRTSGSTVGNTSDARFTLATINIIGTQGVKGIILFPDGITVESTAFSSLGSVNVSNSATATQCTPTQWAALAAKGCVFLPAAGYRHGTTVEYDGKIGYYWSSDSGIGTNVYSLHFPSGKQELQPDYRLYGESVRLVRQVN